jgi:hydrogenase maturation protease
MDVGRSQLLILGLGNVICQDDGLGIVAIERLLERYEPPPGVEILDGGTMGLSLLTWATETETLLMVDAIRTGEAPGTLVRMEGDEVAPAVRDRLSVHQIGVADLLDGMRLIDRYPPRLLLLGIVPESMELSTERTPAVERALPRLVEAVAEEAAALGHPLIPRESSHASTPDTPRPAAVALGLR